MSMKIGFIVFSNNNFDIDLPLINKSFEVINENNFLKDEVSINILKYDLYFDNPYLVQKINSHEKIHSSIKFYKLFSKTILEQNIIIVPLDAIDILKNESIVEYRNKLENQARGKLYNYLGISDNENKKLADDLIIKISSLIFVQEDEKDFNDTNYLIKVITNFLFGFSDVSSVFFKEFNNLNYIIDSSGIGVYFKTIPCTYNNINSLIILLVICKSYLLSCDKLIELIIHLVNQQQHVNTLNFFDIKNFLFEANKFFICNYFDNPVKLNNNEIYNLYSYIKEKFKLTDYLKEVLIKLENLKNIYNLD